MDHTVDCTVYSMQCTLYNVHVFVFLKLLTLTIFTIQSYQYINCHKHVLLTVLRNTIQTCNRHHTFSRNENIFFTGHARERYRKKINDLNLMKIPNYTSSTVHS